MTTMMKNDVYSKDEKQQLNWKRKMGKTKERENGEKWGKTTRGYREPKTSSPSY